MTMKFRFGAVLAALALLAAACSGGEDTTLALDGPQIADVGEGVVEDGPAADAGEPAAEEGEEAAEEEPADEPASEDPADEAEHPDETFRYDSDLDRARSMVLAPSDVADEYPGLKVDAITTSELDNLSIATRAYGLPTLNFQPVALVDSTDRLTGYQATLLAYADTEVNRGQLLVGAPHPEVIGFWTRVDLFDDDDGASEWIEAMRAYFDALVETGLIDEDSVADVAGLPGPAFSVAQVQDGGFTNATVVMFARDDVVATVGMPGDGAADDAADLARALAVRTYRVQNELVPPRDPFPYDAPLQLPHDKLDSFRATHVITVTDEDGDTLLSIRRRGTYEDAEHYSCQTTLAKPGFETLLTELTVDGNDAWFFLLIGQSERVDVMDDTVALIRSDCVVAPDFWRFRNARDLSALPSATGSTGSGPATAYETDDEYLLSQAFGFGLFEDAELVHYQEYVHEDGWSVAYDHEFRVGRDAAEEYLGFELSGSGDVYIHVTRRVTDANGEDVAIDEWIPFDELFEMDVGEEIELIPAEGG